VILHGCTLEDECRVEDGAILHDGVVVEKHAIVGAGAVVTSGKRVPSGQVENPLRFNAPRVATTLMRAHPPIPHAQVWTGNPAQRTRDVAEEEMEFAGWAEKRYLQAKSHLSQTLRSPEEKEMSLLIEEMTIPSPPPTKPGAEGVAQ